MGLTAKEIYETIKASPYRDGEKAIKEYAKAACNEQKRLCARAGCEFTPYADEESMKIDYIESMLTVKLPELK